MRALDCRDPGKHDDIHFTANSDQDLIGQIQQHRDEYHTEITDDQIREMVTANAYDE
jgi:predicted small metal-binding protein